MTKEYDIRTVADFLAVPADKRDECLRDFKSWLEFVPNADEFAADMKADLGVTVAFKTDCFTWMDDGKSGLQIILEDGA